MAKDATARKEKQAPAEIGGNIKGLHDDIAAARDEIVGLEKERQSINAKIKAARERLEAKGITKKGFAAALSYFKADPEQREGFDQAYLISREAMGLPVKGAQLDLALVKGGE